MTAQITAVQAIEWAMEDVRALPEDAPATAAIDILTRWQARVDGLQPAHTYALRTKAEVGR